MGHSHGARAAEGEIVLDAIDAVEAALAHGIRALADAMARANPAAVPALADRMATLAKELEARRPGRSSTPVVDFAAEAQRRRRR
jgi:hypothetical protein